MRTILFTIGALAYVGLASSVAEAKSETQCRAEARDVTGDIQGLDFEQALAGCMLENSPPVKASATPATLIIKESPQPAVAFTGSRQVSSGTWVRVSAHRGTLKRD